jgi:hypothetical protein
MPDRVRVGAYRPSAAPRGLVRSSSSSRVTVATRDLRSERNPSGRLTEPMAHASARRTSTTCAGQGVLVRRVSASIPDVSWLTVVRLPSKRYAPSSSSSLSPRSSRPITAGHEAGAEQRCISIPIVLRAVCCALVSATSALGFGRKGAPGSAAPSSASVAERSPRSPTAHDRSPSKAITRPEVPGRLDL